MPGLLSLSLNMKITDTQAKNVYSWSSEICQFGHFHSVKNLSVTCWFCLRREIKNTSNKQGWVWVGMGGWGWGNQRKRKKYWIIFKYRSTVQKMGCKPPPPPRKSVPTMWLKYTSDVEVLLKRRILPPPPPPTKICTNPVAQTVTTHIMYTETENVLRNSTNSQHKMNPTSKSSNATHCTDW